MKKIIALIPTYIDNDLNITSFYNMNNFNYSKKLEINYDKLCSILDNKEYNDIEIDIVAPESFLWKDIEKFLYKYESRVKRITTSMYFNDILQVKNILNRHKNIKLSVFIAKSSLYSDKIFSYECVLDRISQLFSNIDFLGIFYNIQEYKTFDSDIKKIISDSKIKRNRINFIYNKGFIIDNKDEFNNFIKTYNSLYKENLLSKRSLDISGFIINPNSVNIEKNIQGVEKNCENCYGLMNTYSATCSNCIKFSDQNWNLEAKQLYISEIESLGE